MINEVIQGDCLEVMKGIDDKNEFNYEKYQVLLKTLKRIKEWEECDDFEKLPQKEWIKKGEYLKKDYLFNELVKYIANNMGWYWD
jgi:hypothetical protein